jgi:glycosyltransferase involved in cell wall biosynthesis
VLTAMPNYPKMEVDAAYKGKWFCKEQVDGIDIYRSWIFVRKSKSILPRLLNYFSFVFTSLFSGLFRIPKHNIILCESPPLFLGISAVWLKWLKGSRLVFNVSDLWPESAEKLGIITNKSILSLTEGLEKSIYRKSALISGQTQGIVKNISDRMPGKKTFWLRNGIDMRQFSETQSDFRKTYNYTESDFIIMYGGVLGHAQGLEVILKAAALLKDRTNIKFVIIGDGPEKAELEKLQKESDLSSVLFLPNQPSSKMASFISACDAAIIPLRKLDLFMGAIPSKIFEYLAFRKPILLGVDGEARDLFICEGNCGLYYTPEDAQELADAILKLSSDAGLKKQLGENGREYVMSRFNRQQIAKEFYVELMKLIP